MELSLRKARKLEAKIQATADSLPLSQAIKVRALASSEERAVALSDARLRYNQNVELQRDLITVRFSIREQIAQANESVGVNMLMNEREKTQALLAKSNSGVDVLDIAEAEDMATAKKNSLEGGSSRAYGESSVTITLPVSTKEDVESFRSNENLLKRRLEEIEDRLSQKNLGAKITLDEKTVQLLQSVGLL
ncbi:MAG: hypothetical protein HC840_00155 [Leptolyngbyaceae cyanobacterium RM2_2_4]|nr:hypothetical protein [Leptolyngbyaceae cyanobacterium RM2_2_4]